MPPRTPQQSDFPSGTTLEIIPPPPTHPATNILIVLHGLGDTHSPFAAFARAMALPETLALAIRAGAPLPFDLGGFHWADDVEIDSGSGELTPDGGFEQAARRVGEDIIADTLLRTCGYSARNVVLFGFGQGGMLALEIAKRLGSELGGVVSVGGGLPGAKARVAEVGAARCRTPALVCRGREGSAVSSEMEDKIRETFEFAEVREWPRKGDGMPRNREEMLPIMQFLARRLRSVRGVPKGSVEIT